MSLSISLVNIFLSPIAVGAARQRARARKLTDFFHQGVAIYCPADKVDLFKAALDEVVSFYGSGWSLRRKNVKCIVTDNELQTRVWVARRTVIIQENDADRLGSVKDLAGWLIADYERIQISRRRHCSVVVWNGAVSGQARQMGLEQREQYLAEK
jgi:hypothetical protein